MWTPYTSKADLTANAKMNWRLYLFFIFFFICTPLRTGGLFFYVCLDNSCTDGAKAASNIAHKYYTHILCIYQHLNSLSTTYQWTFVSASIAVAVSHSGDFSGGEK